MRLVSRIERRIYLLIGQQLSDHNIISCFVTRKCDQLLHFEYRITAPNFFKKINSKWVQ